MDAIRSHSHPTWKELKRRRGGSADFSRLGPMGRIRIKAKRRGGEAAEKDGEMHLLFDVQIPRLPRALASFPARSPDIPHKFPRFPRRSTSLPAAADSLSAVSPSFPVASPSFPCGSRRLPRLLACLPDAPPSLLQRMQGVIYDFNRNFF